MSNKALLTVWRGMHNRCYNKNQKSYIAYGARGIFVDQRWHGKDGFDAFLKHMGERPEGGMIERIDNDGPYSPENCRWALRDEQVRNKRNNRWLTANGERLMITEWARRLSCTPTAILMRLRSGMSEEAAVTTPIPERPNAKLTMEDARFVRSTYPMMTAQAIADKLGVSKKTILNIIHGKTFVEGDR